MSGRVSEMSGVLTRDTVQKLGSVERVLKVIEQTATKARRPPPRLVAASKSQPIEKITWAFSHGLRHFGENYVKELHSKSTLLQACDDMYRDVRWHFIGNLQTKKVKKLLECPGLWMVETVWREKTARVLNNGWGLSRDSSSQLRVLLQVNTSRIQNKQGCLPEELPDLASFIMEDCPHLQLCGLMTAGVSGNHQATPTPTMSMHQGQTCSSLECPSSLDFMKLSECREALLTTGIPPQSLTELSMGMTADYQYAIKAGSTSVRIGTAVFGPRKVPLSSDDSSQPSC